MIKMTIKSYDVICDYCGEHLGRYPQYAPTATKLRADGIKVVFNNGKARHLCIKCYKSHLTGR